MPLSALPPSASHAFCTGAGRVISLRKSPRCCSWNQASTARAQEAHPRHSSQEKAGEPPTPLPGCPPGPKQLHRHIPVPDIGTQRGQRAGAEVGLPALYLGTGTLAACLALTRACCVALSKSSALQPSVFPNGKWPLCSNSQNSVKINKPEAEEADLQLGCPGATGSSLPFGRGRPVLAPAVRPSAAAQRLTFPMLSLLLR